MSRLERLCDATVRLESFAGSDKAQSPLYQDYHGEHNRDKLALNSPLSLFPLSPISVSAKQIALSFILSHNMMLDCSDIIYTYIRTHAGLFHLVKLPCLNTLCPHLPETLDLAFKLKRKKFSIEVYMEMLHSGECSLVPRLS